MSKYTTEKSIKIYDDTTGDYILVGPDPDTGEAVEIASFVHSKSDNTTGREAGIILADPEQALEVAKAIFELYGSSASD